MLLYIIYIVY